MIAERLCDVGHDCGAVLLSGLSRFQTGFSEPKGSFSL